MEHKLSLETERRPYEVLVCGGMEGMGVKCSVRMKIARNIQYETLMSKITSSRSYQ